MNFGIGAPSGPSGHLPRFAGEDPQRCSLRDMDPPLFTGEVARSAGGGIAYGACTHVA
jgi:hypothetical protein